MMIVLHSLNERGQTFFIFFYLHFQTNIKKLTEEQADPFLNPIIVTTLANNYTSNYAVK